MEYHVIHSVRCSGCLRVFSDKLMTDMEEFFRAKSNIPGIIGKIPDTGINFNQTYRQIGQTRIEQMAQLVRQGKSLQEACQIKGIDVWCESMFTDQNEINQIEELLRKNKTFKEVSIILEFTNRLYRTSFEDFCESRGINRYCCRATLMSPAHLPALSQKESVVKGIDRLHREGGREEIPIPVIHQEISQGQNVSVIKSSAKSVRQIIPPLAPISAQEEIYDSFTEMLKGKLPRSDPRRKVKLPRQQDPTESQDYSYEAINWAELREQIDYDNLFVNNLPAVSEKWEEITPIELMEWAIKQGIDYYRIYVPELLKMYRIFTLRHWARIKEIAGYDTLIPEQLVETLRRSNERVDVGEGHTVSVIKRRIFRAL